MPAALDTFERAWKKHETNQELIYTATEKDWRSLWLSGRELLWLFSVRFADGSIPLLKKPEPRFQVQYLKEVFPGDPELGGIEFTAYIDMLACVRDAEKIVVDIKTSGVALDDTAGILALDPQLRSYAWITGIPNVAFLWLQKVNRELKAGSRVTVLEGEHAGREMLVGKYTESEQILPNLCLLTEKEYEEMPRGQKKQDIEDRLNYLARHAVICSEKSITKQRIQFVTAHISADQQTEIARQIGHDVAEIHSANKDNFWPQTGGVRYPNNKCTSCSMRGICLNNPKLRDTLLIRKDAEFDAPED